MFTVNEAETEVTMAQGGLLKGWIKKGARTLLLTIGSGKVARHDVIVVSEDGKTATYKMDIMGNTVYRGTFHKKN